MGKNKISIEDYRKFIKKMNEIDDSLERVPKKNGNIYDIINFVANYSEDFLNEIYDLAKQQKELDMASKLFVIVQVKRFVNLNNALKDGTIDAYLKSLDLSTKCSLRVFIPSVTYQNNPHLKENEEQIISLLSTSIKEDMVLEAKNAGFDNVGDWMEYIGLGALVSKDFRGKERTRKKINLIILLSNYKKISLSCFI